MKPPMILTVTSLLSLACGVAQASPATPPHRLEPNAPRSVTVSEAQTPPVIRAGLLQSTLILLPAEEKIATVFGGDTVDWVFDGGHVASRFISVKPKLANTTTDIHIVSDHGNEYTSSVILLFACLKSSCTVFTSSPFAFSNVPKEWRKVCQPMFLVMPARRATGLMYRFMRLSGQ